MPAERELTEPTDIATPDGRVRRDAIGWSRHPLHRGNLGPHLSRVARWSYWCITGRGGALTLLLADVAGLGVALVSFLDLAERRRPIEALAVVRGGLPPQRPDTPRGDLLVDTRRVKLSLRMRGDDLVITGEARGLLGARVELDLAVARPPAHESVNVLLAWDDERYHFTSKQQGLPARGVVRAGGREHHFGPDDQAFACLDFGRGRWPSQIAWGWAFASARLGPRVLGMNLGATWTDGTGVTENGLVLDGRLHKIADPVDFVVDRRDPMRPWLIRTRAGGRVDLRFQPLRERAVNLWRLAELHQHVGLFSGTLLDDAGEPVILDEVLGVAETFRGRWWL